MNALIQEFINILGRKRILFGDALNERYYHIWKMDEGLKAKALLMPETTKEISAILKLCHNKKQPVITFGGLTNLVGSTESTEEEVIISMERMNKIEALDSQSRTLTVQSGVILEHIHNYAKDNGFFFPLSFGAKGSAQIGGAISTNAGGLRVLRYGMTRNLVLGIEAVLADGTIVSNLKKIIKDNSAYDIKQLFIGSEGTLGVVTRAVLKLTEIPQSRVSAFIGINDYNNVVKLLRHLDKAMDGTLSGFELIWKNTFIQLTQDASVAKSPLPYDYNYYVLVEGLGSNPQKDRDRLEQLLEIELHNETIEDAVMAYSDSDLNEFWHIRENVDALVAVCNYDQHFDISLPISQIGRTIVEIEEQLKQIEGVESIFPFGHVADGNIHFIIGKANNCDQLRLDIDQVVYSPLKDLGGSVSAEHGIGVHKKEYLSLCRTEEEILLMKQLKRALDPHCILNRGKVIDV